MALEKITTDIIADDAVTAAKIVAGAVEVDIRAGSVTGDKIGYLGDGTGNLSGTIANQQLHFGTAFTLTDNLTVNGDLTLGKVRDDGLGQSLTGSGRTLTGTGTLTMGSYVEGEPKAGRVTAENLTAGSIGSAVTGGAGLTPYGSAYAVFWDTKNSGTNGGTFTSGQWQTRDLNNSNINMTGCSRSGNQITLAAGTYWCTAFAPCRDVDLNKARLQNITTGATLILGNTALCSDADSGHSESWMIGVFVLTYSNVLEVQHRCSTTKATFGLGGSTSFGVDEVFTTINLLKIG